MRTRATTRIGYILTSSLALALLGTTFAQESQLEEEEGPTSGVNLAVVAKPTSSYVSGDTTLAALNDGYDPRNSQDRSRRSYGNWPRRGTQWVQYEWNRPSAQRA